jgi:hypothetical protein
MGAGANIAMIVVLAFIIGFFVLVVLPDPAPISSDGNLPPDLSLPAYIKAVQAASTKFAGTTAALVTLVGGLAHEVRVTFGAYDSGQGVSEAYPVSLWDGVEKSIEAAQKTLKPFAQEAAAFDKTVQGWTASTAPYLIMLEKSTAFGLNNDVMKPMGDFLGAEGQLSSLVSAWTAAYEAVSKHMNGTMQGAVNALSSAAGTLKAYGTLNSSPWQKQAKGVYGQYMALFNHLAGL